MVVGSVEVIALRWRRLTMSLNGLMVRSYWPSCPTPSARSRFCCLPRPELSTLRNLRKSCFHNNLKPERATRFVLGTELACS